MNERTRFASVLVFSFLSAMLLTAILPGSARGAEGEGSQTAAKSGFKEVRVDLNAGIFLDEIPFDTPFLITATVSESFKWVDVRYNEFLEHVVTVGEDVTKLLSFRDSIRALLRSKLTKENSSTELTISDVYQLRKNIRDTLLGKTGPPKKRALWSARGGLRVVALPLEALWKFGLPWNWDNWTKLLGRERAVIAPGTIFDLDSPRRSVLDDFTRDLKHILGLADAARRSQALDALTERIITAARSARIAFVSSSQRPQPPIRWNRVHPAQFRVLIPPLEAERYYQFDFKLGRGLTPKEFSGFELEARKVIDKKAREMTRGDISRSGGEALRAGLIRSLNEVSEEGRIAASGTLFDPDMPYEDIRFDFIRYLASILEPQLKRDLQRGQLDQYRDLTNIFKQHLDSIRTNTVLRTLVRALEQGQDKEIVALFGEYDLALPLAKLDYVTAPLVAEGRLTLDGDPAKTEKDLKEIWDPGKVAEFRSNFERVREALRQLQRLLGDLVDNTDKVKGLNLQPNEVQSLISSITDMRRDIKDMRRDFESIEDPIAHIHNFAEERSEAIGAMASEAKLIVQRIYLVNATTTLVNTPENHYISADVGLVYAGGIRKTVTYIGSNFYMRPVSKAVPLSQKGGFLRRFALNFGLTVQSIADDRNTREDFFSNQALLLGAGYRISQFIRVGGGALVFWERDPGTFPLTEKKNLAMTPYASVSFDADIGKTLQGIGSLFDLLKKK